MPGRIEDYAIIGNCETAALVGRDGSIDWMCLPRFDSAACFAALLGDDKNGRWLIAPSTKITCITRAYREGTLVLETTFETATGSAILIDCMAREHGASVLLRQVKGLTGFVDMHCDLLVRFDYGGSIPWVTCLADKRVQFIAGPDRLILQADISIENANMRSCAAWRVTAGEAQNFSLTYTKSYLALPPRLDTNLLITHETTAWKKWSGRFSGEGEWSSCILRSLITLKALTHYETGGIVAAATTSLPELIGGGRNWDYRFCWLRDATLTLSALMESNYVEEAAAWQQWLLRAVAGTPADLNIMYGIAGERRLDEFTIRWLPGYESSAPVRIGNAAAGQRQLDIFGEIMDALYLARKKGLPADPAFWSLQRALITHLRTIWDRPDDGIWEVRGDRRQFTHSKIMAWVAVDRAIRSAEDFALEGPLDDWRTWRDEIHAQVCQQGYDSNQKAFVQSYGSKKLDASLLMIALVGFLPVDDERVAGTIAAIEQNLIRDGFVLRYQTDPQIDGLPAGEGAFLACSFWLTDNYVLQGRIEEAKVLFRKLIALCNDVGLLSEEYDPVNKRQIGNFPQAFSHIGLINTAYNLSRFTGPAAARAEATKNPVNAPVENRANAR